MTVYWVYKILPVFVRYTVKFNVLTSTGKIYGPFVFINPNQSFPHVSKEGELALREHEIMHVKQFYRTFGFAPLLYNYSKKYRLKYEIESYKVSIKYDPLNIESFASFISTRYEINITKEAALALLTA